MSRDYDEKRDFFRMTANCEMTYKVEGQSDTNPGHCINLSAGGVLFTGPAAVAEDSIIEINISPEKTVVPPLNALIKVIRCDNSGPDGSYEIAGAIEKLL